MINADWHGKHPMPRNATVEERIAWHRAHASACACRPIPASLLARMGTPVASGFDAVKAAFAGDRAVSTGGGKGFGAVAKNAVRTR